MTGIDRRCVGEKEGRKMQKTKNEEKKNEAERLNDREDKVATRYKNRDKVDELKIT